MPVNGDIFGRRLTPERSAGHFSFFKNLYHIVLKQNFKK